MTFRFRRYTSIELASITISYNVSPMNLANHLLKLLVALCADRQALVLQNIALRQQVMVMQRSIKKAKLEDSDRVFWILLSRIWVAKPRSSRRLSASFQNHFITKRPNRMVAFEVA